MERSMILDFQNVMGPTKNKANSSWILHFEPLNTIIIVSVLPISTWFQPTLLYSVNTLFSSRMRTGILSL